MVKLKIIYTGAENMFGKPKKEKEKVTVVTTKEQLIAAVKRKDACIEVKGELAVKMKWMAKLSPKKIAIIISCLTVSVATPTTVPVTASAALATAGLGVAEITVIAGLGAIIVIAIFKNYDIEMKAGDKSLRLIANK